MQRLFDDAQLEWWANQIGAFISTKGHTQQAWESVRSHESYSKQEIEKRPADSEEAKAISEVALLALKVLNSCASPDEYSQTKEPVLQNAKEKIERLLPYCSGWATMYAPLDETLVHFEIKLREENTMTEKIIVIKPDDTIDVADYNDYKSIQGVVNGLIEHFHSFRLPVDPVELGLRRPAADLNATAPSSLTAPSEVGNGKNVTMFSVDLFCNEEFLLIDSDEFDKVNAVASLLSNQEIRGNVAMLIRLEDGDSRGFEYKDYTNDQEGGTAMDYCECSAAMKSVREYIHLHERELKKLHERFDGNKSEPFIEITSWDSNGKMHKSSDRDERS